MTVQVGSRELKNRLGTYLRQVRNGTTILVTDRGRPVAELRPLPKVEEGLDERLAKMAARGLITLPKREKRRDFEPIRLSGRPLSDTISNERDDRF